MNQGPLQSIQVLSADWGAFVWTLDTDPRAALQLQMLFKAQAGSLCLHKTSSVYFFRVYSCVYNWEAILKLYNLLLLQVDFLFIGCVLCFSQPAKCGDEAKATFRQQEKLYFSILDSSLWVSFLLSFRPLPPTVSIFRLWVFEVVMQS